MTRSSLFSSLLLLTGAVLLVPAVADSASGDLDPSFGAGIFRFAYRTLPDTPVAVLRQPDGRVLVAGYAEDAGLPFLARLTADGELDPSFGGGGVVPAGPGHRGAGVDLALQPDGKILLAVASGETVYEAFVARFDTTGNLDPTFGDQGIAYSGLYPGLGRVAVATSQGGQGNIYLAANSLFDGVGIVRFDSGGRLGPAFGGTGVARPGFPGDLDAGIDLALESGILLATWDGYTSRACVVRFAWSGFPDSTFGGEGTGTAHCSVGSASYADVAMDVLPGGKILLAGYEVGAYRDFVFRFDADGTPDPTFGTAGFAPASVATVAMLGLDVVALPDGGAALAGVEDAVPPRPYLAVFDAGGTLRPDYGVGGILSLPIPQEFPADPALAVQPDGALILAGIDRPVERVFVARVVAPGVLDETFRAGGITYADVSGYPEAGRALAIQEDGAILTAGYHFLREAVVVQRLDPLGLRDPDFGAGGLMVLEAVRTGALSPVRILTEPGTHRKYVGMHDADTGEHCIMRLSPSGFPDSTWGTQGVAHTSVSATGSGDLDLALRADGKILAAVNPGSGTGIRVIRFDLTGQVDPTFAGGVVTLAWPSPGQSHVKVESWSDGTVYVAGLDQSTWDLAITRLVGAGYVDPLYGSGGTAHTSVPGTYAVDLAFDNDAVLVAGVDADTYRPYVARFASGGTLDPDFGEAGFAYADLVVDAESPVALAVEPNGWIYVAGHTSNENFVLRFSPDGVADPGFGGDGIATTEGTFDDGSVVDVAIQGDGKVVLAASLETPFELEEDGLVRFQAMPFVATAVPGGPPSAALTLDPCVPNPFRQSTTVRFSLAAASPVRLTVHDVQGRLVATLVDGERPAGPHLLRWGGRDRLGQEILPGVYFLRLDIGGQVRVGRVVRQER